MKNKLSLRSLQRWCRVKLFHAGQSGDGIKIVGGSGAAALHKNTIRLNEVNSPSHFLPPAGLRRGEPRYGYRKCHLFNLPRTPAAGPKLCVCVCERTPIENFAGVSSSQGRSLFASTQQTNTHLCTLVSCPQSTRGAFQASDPHYYFLDTRVPLRTEKREHSTRALGQRTEWLNRTDAFFQGGISVKTHLSFVNQLRCYVLVNTRMHCDILDLKVGGGGSVAAC